MFRTSNKAKEPLTIRRRILCDSCNIFGTSCTDSRENSLVFANIRAKINECSQIFARILANIRVFVNIREYSDIHEYSNIQNIRQDSNPMEAWRTNIHYLNIQYSSIRIFEYSVFEYSNIQYSNIRIFSIQMRALVTVHPTPRLADFQISWTAMAWFFTKLYMCFLSLLFQYYGA